jgi:hypothetical protein
MGEAIVAVTTIINSIGCRIIAGNASASEGATYDIVVSCQFSSVSPIPTSEFIEYSRMRILI